MGFWKTLILAILNTVNPAISFMGSIIEYVTSESKNERKISTLNLISNLIPGGFIKDVSVGILTDALRVDYLSEAVNKTVPYNNVVLKCDICGIYSHYFIRKDNKIKCSNCFEENVKKHCESNSKIYLISDNINKFHEDLSNSNNMIPNSFLDNKMI